MDDDGDWVFADETTTNWSTGFMAARVGANWYQTTMPILDFEKYETVMKKQVSKINNDDDDNDGEETEEEEDEVEEEEEEEEEDNRVRKKPSANTMKAVQAMKAMNAKSKFKSSERAREYSKIYHRMEAKFLKGTKRTKANIETAKAKGRSAARKYCKAKFGF